MARTNCPYCYNTDIKIIKEYDKEVKPIEDGYSYAYCYDKLLECFCEKCRTHYHVENGYFRYYIFKDKYATNTQDIKMIVSLRSDMFKGYDIVSTYDLFGNELFYFIPYLDPYPYLLTEEQVNEIIEFPEKGKSLSKKIYDDRYKKEI